MLSRALIATLFPYTTLFRSGEDVNGELGPLIVSEHLFVQLLNRRSSLVLIAGLVDVIGIGSPESSNRLGVPPVESRSEEHTSELQSHSDLVCRLLLEKKKRQ